MVTFEGQDGVAIYQAVTLKHAIAFYAKTGMKVNASYTPTNMLKVAGRITGKTYKRREYAQAIADLETWIAQNGNGANH